MNKLPTTMQELDEAMQNFVSEESVEKGKAFKPRPTDVIVSPYAKSGTTWTQQIVHGLRTRGSMDFDEITVVTPWLILAHDMGWDLEGDQVAEPRVFKSHATWHDVPKGARYICPVRHPYKMMVSFYRFFEDWWFEPGSIDIATFLRGNHLKNPDERSYWTHLASWWEQRHNPDVLILCYEDMQADLSSAVKTIAAFIGLYLDDELHDIVMRQSTREFMLQHSRHFDEHPVRDAVANRTGIPPNGNASKITAGTPDEDRYVLPQEIIKELDANWNRFITAPYGLPDYDALRSEIGALRGWGSSV